MGITEILELISGLVMFLFGMNVMSSALEKSAGNKLKGILASMTSNTFKGFLLGLVVTAVIQSSSATTVMVVGFVNSGIMTLHQAVGVIMGANVGTSVTSWILTLTQVDGGAWYIKMFKPDTFVPVLALVGIILFMFQKNSRRKDFGLIMIGFSVLMIGMDIMSGAVSGLKDSEAFAKMFTMFSNPVLGVLIGAIVTAIIQSSSASVGILQALTTTGKISCDACVPIIMGQNIGTCITAMISSVGTSKNAKRAAVIHLCFNTISSVVILVVYSVIKAVMGEMFPLVNMQASALTIAVTHTVFNVLAVSLMMPCTRLLEKLAVLLVRDKNGEKEKKDSIEMLDERLMGTPSVAIERCRTVTVTMAEEAIGSVKNAMKLIFDKYDEEKILEIRESENIVDKYEDSIGTYLVKLSTHSMTDDDSKESNKLLHCIGDFERISDHALNIIGAVEEINDKKLEFSDEAKRELNVLINAVGEILDITLEAFENGDVEKAMTVEPLEQVVDYLKEKLRKHHIRRLRKNECTIEMGFVQTDLLTDLERVSDHCSNIAACIIEMAHDNMDLHEYLNRLKEENSSFFEDCYDSFKTKYSI